MKYFAAATSPYAEALARLRASNEESLKRIENARARLKESGTDPDMYGILDPVKQRSENATSEEKWAQEEAARRALLDEIRQQADADAGSAWHRGDRFFAPVLFQTLARSDGDWEAALTQITELGWRLDSWQVIGPAPDPFSYTVTLIQTLFTR